MAKIETRNAYAFELKSIAEDGTIEGYASVFGVIDSYDDIVAPGAFAASIAAHKAAGTMPAMLWQHDTCEPIGVWTEMVEDSNGLRVKGQLVLECEKGASAYALLKKGALNGLSIGFMSKQWSYDQQAGIRTLNEIDLWEVSIVTFPANQESQIASVKSVDDVAMPKDAERVLRDAGFSKADATAFVSRLMRMGAERREADHANARALKAAEKLLKLLQS